MDNENNYLNHIIPESSVELDVCEEPAVVSRAETGLDDPLPVTQDVELR